MAGERTGKTYEALIKISLDRLKQRNRILGDVFWNETPEGINVEPDFIIGRTINQPEIVIMVTHFNASKQSIMKYWRNLGELCEIKTSLSPSPVAINIIFNSVMEESLKVLQSVAFDGQIIFGDKVYSQELQSWVDSNEALLPANQNEKVDTIIRLSNSNPELYSLLENIEADLEKCIDHSSQNLGQLWELEKQRHKGTPPTCRETCIRRGLSKLLIFEDIDLGIALYKGERIRPEKIPDYIYETSLAKKTISKAVPVDHEILSAVSMLKEEEIKKICQTTNEIEVMQAYLSRIRSSGNISYMGEYILSEYSSLINEEVLYERIIELHNDPKALMTVPNSNQYWPPSDVWIISYLIELIKAQSGKANGFGNQQLAKEVVASGFGTTSDRTSASQFGGGFGFASWLTRNPSAFKDELVKGIAHVLSKHLNEIGYENVRRLVESHRVQQVLINNLIEAKLCTHPSFMPLYTLLSDSITCSIGAIKTCFAEKAGLNGTAGNTTVAICGKTIIVWKTATDSGKDHKRKELCGKAVGLRYTWDGKNKQFITRPGVEKIILLLDGTWTQKDLNALVNAGWDEVFYPDEIDKLKAAIV